MRHCIQLSLIHLICCVLKAFDHVDLSAPNLKQTDGSTLQEQWYRQAVYEELFNGNCIEQIRILEHRRRDRMT